MNSLQTCDVPGCNHSAHRVYALDDDGKTVIAYDAQPHQLTFHASTTPNLLALGTRGTGKSVQLRWDAHMRCLMIPNFHALILRRTMPDLRKSHIKYIEREMKLLGGVYLQTTFLAKYPNGSTLLFAHCETEADILNFLSSEYGFIGFDELSTFTLQQFLQISIAARAPEHCGYDAVIRASSNPLGPGAEWMEQWFVTRTVSYEDYPDYNPDDFEMQFSTLRENKYINAAQYEARLKNLPDHVRRAWLKGEFVFEGMYFTDFRKVDDDGNPWHVLNDVPTFQGEPIYNHPWLSIYRAIDWGYHPDPAVCLWIAVLPNKRAIVFKEKHWKRVLAADVAKDIVRESAGMRVVESFCDPSMLIKEGQVYSIGEIFESNGVPVTAATNDRILYGYAVNEYLNNLIDGKPQVQFVKGLGTYGCAHLIKTIPQLRMDKLDARKIANGDDHWVVAFAYFAMGAAPPSRDRQNTVVKPWMVPKSKRRSWASC